MYNVGLSLLTLSIKMAGDRWDENGGKRENAKREKQKKTGEYKCRQHRVKRKENGRKRKKGKGRETNDKGV